MKKMLKRLISMGVAAVMTVMCAAALSVPVFADADPDVFTYIDFDNCTQGKELKTTDLITSLLATYYTGVSKISAGAENHVNALNILTAEPCPVGTIYLKNGNNVNITQTKNMIGLDLMFKADGSFNIYFSAHNKTTGKDENIQLVSAKALLDSNKISKDEWYIFSARAYKSEGVITTEIKDLSGKTVYNGGNIKKDFTNTFTITGYNLTMFGTKNVDGKTYSYPKNVFVDEIKMFQADDEMTVPLETNLFTEDFESYTEKSYLNPDGSKVWDQSYIGGSQFVKDTDRNGMVLKVQDYDKNSGKPSNNYQMVMKNKADITPTMDVVVLNMWLKAGTEDGAKNLAIKDKNDAATIININMNKKTVDSKSCSSLEDGKWYHLVSEINIKTEKVKNTITDSSGMNIYSNEKTLSGIKNFKGIMLKCLLTWETDRTSYSYFFFDDINITQRCGTPAIDGTKDIKFITPDGKEATETANVSAAANTIELNFTTPMDLDSLKNGVTIEKKNGESKINYSGKLSKDYKTYIMTLNDVLSTETEYAVKVGSGVKAYTGESIGNENTISFTTAKGEMSGKITGVKIGGSDVTAVTQLTTDTTMDITIDYVNTLGTEELNGYVIVAYFNGNKLIAADYGAKIHKDASVKSETITLERTVPDFGTETLTSAKLMFWNGLDKMIPITDAYPIPNSSTNQ